MVHRILLVDDNDTHASALEMTLRKADFEVVRVGTGPGALYSAIKYAPDLILIDEHLPGIKIARQLKSRPQTRSIPIVLHSASHAAEASQIAAACGADAFLTYPIEPEHLLQMIGGGLSRATAKAA